MARNSMHKEVSMEQKKLFSELANGLETETESVNRFFNLINF